MLNSTECWWIVWQLCDAWMGLNLYLFAVITRQEQQERHLNLKMRLLWRWFQLQVLVTQPCTVSLQLLITSVARNEMSTCCLSKLDSIEQEGKKYNHLSYMETACKYDEKRSQMPSSNLLVWLLKYHEYQWMLGYSFLPLVQCFCVKV